MSNSAKFFKRQSGQMDAVAAEAKEILEATIEMVTRLKSDPPSPLSLPPPPASAIPDSHRVIDTGRYSVHNPPGSLHPAPVAHARLVGVPRPAGPAWVPPPEPTAPLTSEVRRVARKVGEAERQEFRPLPPPLPRRRAGSSQDNE